MRKSALLALSLIGLFDSLYLWWTYASPSRPMVCMGDGCDAVRASVFAYPFGIPMPAFGVAMYAGLAALVFAEPLLGASLARAERPLVAGISGLGFLFSLYLSGVEAFVLHAWCFWCVISAIAVTLIFGLALWDVLRPLPEPDASGALALARKQFATVVGWVVLGAPAFLLLSRAGALPPPPQISPALLERLVRPDSHMTGNLNASLTVVEFADIQCPACSRAEENAQAIRRQYGNRVRFVFRHLPLPGIHIYAQQAAEATECAAEQGKFWEALERFYRGQNDLREPALERYAGELGLDVERFRRCLASESAAARVNRDADDAHVLGVNKTPTFFIGTQVVEGLLGVDSFARIVEQELARAGPAPTEAMLGSATAPNLGNPSSPGSTDLGSMGSFGGSAAFTAQLGGSDPGCSEADAQKQQATLINTLEARRLFEGNPQALFVDVRDDKDFRAAHIPGAVNVPAGRIREEENRLPRSQTIVLYESGHGSGDICAAGRAAGRTLLARGYSSERVKVYHDGLAGWESAGLPIER